MLEIQNVTKSFGALEVLRGVDLTVEKGDVAAIIGPSGSGKTTLLRCMNFLERAGSGTMIFDGERVDLARVSGKEAARLRRKTAFVFQSYNLFRNKTALQNVTEGLTVARKIPREQAAETARRALRKVGMLDRADHYPHQLSGGQQQRVAIARAIATSPPIIMADEPTGALDSKTGRHVLEILHALHQEMGTTVILITHDNSIAATAERVVRISDGKIIYDGDSQDPQAVVQAREEEEAEA